MKSKYINTFLSIVLIASTGGIEKSFALQQANDAALSRLTIREDRTIEDIIELCVKYESENKIAEAISLLEQSKTRYTQSVGLRKLLAKYYLEEENVQKAIVNYEEIVNLSKNNPEDWAQLGELYTSNDQQEQAITAYEKALQLDRENTAVLNALQQLYSWNDQGEKAFIIQRELLKYDSQNKELWKQHGIQARWYNKNDEAIASFRKALALEPNDVEAFFLLGETYFWINRTEEAELCFHQVLQMQPEHVQARFYHAQIRHWQPFGWWEAKKNYRWILKRQPGHQESQQYYDLIRTEYGPYWQNRGTYIRDSNDLHKMEISSGYEQYLSPHWKIGGNLLYRNFEEQKPTGHFQTYGQGILFGNTFYLNQRTNFYGSIGYLSFNHQERFILSEFHWQQRWLNRETWPGQFISTLAFKYDQVMDGVLAVKNSYTARGFQFINYWEPEKRAHFGSDVQYFWYSDHNEKTQIYLTGEYQFYSGKPSFFLEGVYAFQDMKKIYPFALPYWTPDNFWTRSLGMDILYEIRHNLIFRGGYALAQQPGDEIANNWKAEINWHPNHFSYLYLHYYDFGSQYYSSQGWLAGFTYRW